MFGPLLYVQMSFRVARAGDSAPGQESAKREGFCNSFKYNLQYITLRYTTLQSITLHYTTLHYTTPRYTPLHSIPLHYTTFNYITHNYYYSYN